MRCPWLPPQSTRCASACSGNRRRKQPIGGDCTGSPRAVGTDRTSKALHVQCKLQWPKWEMDGREAFQTRGFLSFSSAKDFLCKKERGPPRARRYYFQTLPRHLPWYGMCWPCRCYDKEQPTLGTYLAFVSRPAHHPLPQGDISEGAKTRHNLCRSALLKSVRGFGVLCSAWPASFSGSRIEVGRRRRQHEHARE